MMVEIGEQNPLITFFKSLHIASLNSQLLFTWGGVSETGAFKIQALLKLTLNPRF